jgi:flagellar hook-associated protein 2
MAGITSTTGLITGIPIQDTVDKLIAAASTPKNNLTARNTDLQSQQAATSQLSALVSAFQFEVNTLKSGGVFDSKSVTSSDTDVLTAALQKGGTPAAGTYNFRTLQTASADHLVSNAFDSVADLADSGSLSFGFGGFINTGINLSQINGGNGVTLGNLKITDRAGNTATVDLRAARTVDDVLTAINSTQGIDVTASIDGDSIKLVDNTGESGNLKVQEVSGGHTAADLGLAGISVADNSATGTDIFAIGANTNLNTLNDGNGVELNSAGNDLHVTLADATSLDIDLGSSTTVGGVLTALNAASPTKLTAAISADGNRIVLTDHTSGVGTFAVTDAGAGKTAEDLGLTTTASSGTINGSRLVSGLSDSLLSSLRGGAGIGTLGDISLTNRGNVSSTVHLAGAETVGDVVKAINSQAVGVTAALNSSRNGIVLTDTTGGTASNLVVGNGDGTNSADALGLSINSAVTGVDSGTLARQTVSRATLLSSLNGGAGIDLHDFTITDSAGHTGAVDLNTLGHEAKTVGDVIDRINALSPTTVEARINDTGDGILLVDKAGGDGSLTVGEVGASTAAADLKLLGKGVAKTVDGQPTQVIDGSSRFTVDLSDLGDAGASVTLASLNAGKGVQRGSFQITDSNGQTAVVVLGATGGTFNTVSDVLKAINATNIGVQAKIDDTGNGILLYDTAGGSGTLKVQDLAGGTAAADLGLNETVKTIDVNGTPSQTIDGAGSFAQSAKQSGLDALVARINGLNAGVSASTFFDGQGYRLSLTSSNSGAGNDLLVDGSAGGLSFTELGKSRDAAIEFGGTALGSGAVVTSPTNTFSNVISGVDLTVNATSDQNVSVTVAASPTDITSAVQGFVDAYNSVRSDLDSTTDFNSTDFSTGILFGSSAALRVDQDLSHVLTSQFFGVGSFSSLAAVGISLDSSGKLSLDTTKLQSAFTSDPASLQKLFTDPTNGIAAKFGNTLSTLVGDDNSVLPAQTKSLADTISTNTKKIQDMSDALDRQRQTLLDQFAALESTVATLQENLQALSSFTPIPPLTLSTSSSTLV